MTRDNGGGEKGESGGRNYVTWFISGLAVLLQIVVIANQYSSEQSAQETEQDGRLSAIECALKYRLKIEVGQKCEGRQ